MAHSELEWLLRQRLGKNYHIGSERGFGNDMDSVVVYANDLDSFAEIIHRLRCKINQARNTSRNGEAESPMVRLNTGRWWKWRELRRCGSCPQSWCRSAERAACGGHR